MRKKADNSLSVIGIKQTYFIKQENIEKLKSMKKETKKGYSQIVNDLIEEAENNVNKK